MSGGLVSAGLCDLQVNGYAGVDFNDAGLTAPALDRALGAMRKSGVTLCLPTLITAPPDVLAARFAALDAAVAASRLGPSMVPGYHLEGPFLNAADGYAGCHPKEAMGDPDAALVERLAAGLSRPILLVTMAPERPGSVAFIRSMREAGRLVAVGHSAANFAEVRAAAEAGLSVSTHLGNGLPHSLPKLDNTLMAQLAEERLAACFIADGIHLPPEALRVMIRAKGEARSILVTDAVLAAAAPPGRYTFAGSTIERGADGVVHQPGSRYLAGSSLCLDAAIRNLVAWKIAGPAQAIAMASDHPFALLAPVLEAHGIDVDPGHVHWSDDLRPVSTEPASIAA